MRPNASPKYNSSEYMPVVLFGRWLVIGSAGAAGAESWPMSVKYDLGAFDDMLGLLKCLESIELCVLTWVGGIKKKEF